MERANYDSVNVAQIPKPGNFSKPRWTRSKKDERGRSFPDAIAHRGCKAQFPENSLAAMQGAVQVGALGLETDVHLSRDGVVVLSHDKDLKRCFGVDKKLIDCDWEYLRTLRSTRAPGEPLARLQDLLEYIAQPGLEHVWLLLDIKIDDDLDDLLRLISETIFSVKEGARRWKERIVLGCWTPRYLTPCAKYLPEFPICHISPSTWYAQQFFDVPNCSFNIFQKALIGPFGAEFRRKIKKLDRQLFVWTVNETKAMKWCIQKEVDGVVTDDPKRFLEICDSWRDDEPMVRPTLLQYFENFCLCIIVATFMWLIRIKYPGTVKQFLASQPTLLESHGEGAKMAQEYQ